MRSVGTRRQCMIESLERSSYDSGLNKQHSGFGFADVFRRRSNAPGEGATDHVSKVYRNLDPAFADGLQAVTLDSFPIKRLYNACHQHQAVWVSKQSRTQRTLSDNPVDQVNRINGRFPYVDDRVTVLSELTKANILQVRHRVNSECHPKWALRTIRRRRRKLLLKAKRRSIGQEATRILQARLLANHKSKKT